MPRFLLLAAALLPVTLTSCSPQRFLQLIVEHQAAQDQAAEDHANAAGQTIDGWEAAPASPPAGSATGPAVEIWEQLRAWQQQAGQGQGITANEIEQLIASIDELGAPRDIESEADALQHELFEARMAALELGATLQPDRFLAKRDAYYRACSGEPYDAFAVEQAAVQRFVSEQLRRPHTDDALLAALSRHVIRYPRCEMNVEFYLATLERLISEHRIEEAAALARDGMRQCAGHSDVEWLQSRLAEIYAKHPGAPGTPLQFKSPTLRRSVFDLKSLRGRPVLVTFWATWCPACVEEIPKLKQLHERYRDQDLEIVSVSLDTDRAALADFVQQHQLPWPHMFSARANSVSGQNPIAERYGVRSIPSLFLLDAEGIILAADVGNVQAIDAKLRQHATR